MIQVHSFMGVESQARVFKKAPSASTEKLRYYHTENANDLP